MTALILTWLLSESAAVQGRSFQLALPNYQGCVSLERTL